MEIKWNHKKQSKEDKKEDKIEEQMGKTDNKSWNEDLNLSRINVNILNTSSGKAEITSWIKSKTQLFAAYEKSILNIMTQIELRVKYWKII